MPYKDIAAFRRSYRSKEGSFAHERSHNLVRDYKQLQSYREELGRASLPKTLENYQKIVYNKSDKENLDHYIEARRRGSVSAVASFSDWQETDTRLKAAFIGQTAQNGVKVTSVGKHFVDRTIGTIYLKDDNKKREGVLIKDIQKVVFNGIVGRTKKDSFGRNSTLLYIDNVADVTINTETGVLIQCNPNSK